MSNSTYRIRITAEGSQRSVRELVAHIEVSRLDDNTLRLSDAIAGLLRFDPTASFLDVAVGTFSAVTEIQGQDPAETVEDCERLALEANEAYNVIGPAYRDVFARTFVTYYMDVDTTAPVEAIRRLSALHPTVEVTLEYISHRSNGWSGHERCIAGHWKVGGTWSDESDRLPEHERPYQEVAAS